jgi:flagellar biosynthesis repressor protein FlbT
MKTTFKVTLKANEKLYVNGAVIRSDRKVSLEFLNDVQFLLESHVLQAEDANTPLRQLYFIVQVMQMNPGAAEEARAMFRRSLPLLMSCFSDARILGDLKQVDRLVSEDNVFEALKTIRQLYGIEAEILAKGTDSTVALPLAAAE